MAGITNVSNPSKQEMQDQWIPDSDWHYVGDTGEPAFENSWVNYGGGTYADARFRIDAEGWVYLGGLVKSGTAQTTIFTLPEGYRPDTEIYLHSQVYNNDVAYVQITAAGAVSMEYVAGANNWNNLDGVMFKANRTRWMQAPTYRPAMPVKLYAGTTQDQPWMCQRRNGMNTINGITSTGVELTGTSNHGGLGKFLPPRSYMFGIADGSANHSQFQIGPKLNIYQAGNFTTYGTYSHEYGSAEIEDQWISAANLFVNSWFTLGSDTHNDWTQGGYYKDQFGVVHLRGLISGGSSATALMFTLPEGYRPSHRLMFAVAASGATDQPRVDVLANGQVLPVVFTSTTWTSICNIKFFAEN